MNLYSISGPFKGNGQNEQPESPLLTVLGCFLYAVIVAIMLICI